MSKTLLNQVLRNRYTIQSEIASGGMGSVYLAWDEQTQHEVAVKYVPFGAHASGDKDLFESALLLQLDHDHLPKIYQAFRDQQAHYLVMEYIAGDTLGDRVRKKHFLPDEAVIQLWPLLKVLQYLHEQTPPIIHRDIKPSNLKFNQDGRLMLVDFGIAKQFVQSEETRMSARWAYTPSYAPPEQIFGQGTDQRSDLFTMGAVLYFMLTGVPPRYAVERYADKEEMLDPTQMEAVIPLELGQIISKATALDMDARYTSAFEMYHALIGVLPRLASSFVTGSMPVTPPTPPTSATSISIPPTGATPPPSISIPPTGTTPPTSASTQQIGTTPPTSVSIPPTGATPPPSIPPTGTTPPTSASTQQTGTTPPTSASIPPTDATPPASASPVLSTNTVSPIPNKLLSWLPLIIIVLFVLLIGGAGTFFMVSSRSEEAATEVVVAQIPEATTEGVLETVGVNNASTASTVPNVLTETPLSSVTASSTATPDLPIENTSIVVTRTTPSPAVTGSLTVTLTAEDATPSATPSVTPSVSNTPQVEASSTRQVVNTALPVPTEAPPATIVPLSTATRTRIPVATLTNRPAPTATAIPTAVPPTVTAVPPTAVFPTAAPSTATIVFPTAIAISPTAVPPTAVPPTAVPPTAVPPTVIPPTATAVPPTAVPPTATPTPRNVGISLLSPTQNETINTNEVQFRVQVDGFENGDRLQLIASIDQQNWSDEGVSFTFDGSAYVANMNYQPYNAGFGRDYYWQVFVIGPDGTALAISNTNQFRWEQSGGGTPALPTRGPSQLPTPEPLPTR